MVKIIVPFIFKKFVTSSLNRIILFLSRSLEGSSRSQNSTPKIKEKYNLAKAALFFNPSDHCEIYTLEYFSISTLLKALIKLSLEVDQPFICTQVARFSKTVKSCDKPFLVSI